MFKPGSRREAYVKRRPTARQYLKSIVALPIDCEKAVAVYARLETAEKGELQSLGAHLVTSGGHSHECPIHDPKLRRAITTLLQDGLP